MESPWLRSVRSVACSDWVWNTADLWSPFIIWSAGGTPSLLWKSAVRSSELPLGDQVILQDVNSVRQQHLVAWAVFPLLLQWYAQTQDFAVILDPAVSCKAHIREGGFTSFVKHTRDPTTSLHFHHSTLNQHTFSQLLGAITGLSITSNYWSLLLPCPTYTLLSALRSKKYFQNPIWRFPGSKHYSTHFSQSRKQNPHFILKAFAKNILPFIYCAAAADPLLFLAFLSSRWPFSLPQLASLPCPNSLVNASFKLRSYSVQPTWKL